MVRETSSDFLRIDISAGKIRKIISACQSESIHRTIHFNIVNSGMPIDLSNLFYAEILVKRVDGTEVDNACIIDGDDICYTLKSNDIAVIGENEAHLRLTFNDGTDLETPVFYLNVFSSFYNPDALQSHNDYDTITQQALNASASATAAAGSADAAASSATDAAASATNAATSDLAASISATSAASNATDAAVSATAAATSATSASNSATAAESYKNAAASSASTASTKATEAASSATSALSSATTATNKATAASNSADAAAVSAASVGNKAEQAAESAADAASSASEVAGYLETILENVELAEEYKDAAVESASTATTKATAAASSADDAAASATTATTKASNASDSATAAAGSASTATTKASEASASATAAANSASSAAGYKADAKTYKESAEYYAGKAEEAYQKMGEEGLVLGETSVTAYRGDRGKTAYDDSQTNKASIGTMANLGTTEKGSLVGAVNEVKTEVGTKQAATDNTLNTTSKTIPGAINELLAKEGTANGIAELDANGKVPSSQLPSFVDDVIEGYYKSSNGKFYLNKSGTTYSNEVTGESGKIYIDKDSEKTYRWSGSAFVVVSETLALGETSSTAYRGDRGKTAYDDSQTNKSHIGTMSNLTTTEKGSLVGAINELVTTAGTKQAATDNSLNTTSKQIVGAINELVSRVATLEGMIGYPINPS